MEEIESANEGPQPGSNQAGSEGQKAAGSNPTGLSLEIDHDAIQVTSSPH
jgi:hypothetical protein